MTQSELENEELNSVVSCMPTDERKYDCDKIPTSALFMDEWSMFPPFSDRSNIKPLRNGLIKFFIPSADAELDEFGQPLNNVK